MDKFFIKKGEGGQRINRKWRKGLEQRVRQQEYLIPTVSNRSLAATKPDQKEEQGEARMLCLMMVVRRR